jgi:X-linked retinitis pigmentosa GTPase regulator
MQRFRNVWVALAGGALLVTLSISAAFGADPADSEGNRGQTIAAFVHELVFGDNDQADDEVNEDDDTDTDTDEDESTEDESEVIDSGGEITDPETTEEDETEDTESSTREVPEEFANHGECVSEAAHDAEGFAESEAANKGEWVSQNARYTCWGLEVPGDDTEEEATGDTDESTVDETDTDTADTTELSAKEQRKADAAAARAERKAERASAKAARTHGGGNGKGHGH